MNIYLLKQAVNKNYDTYDSAVVVARDEKAARKIHPSGYDNTLERCTWCKSEEVEVIYLGRAAKDVAIGVKCASFNAG